MSASPIVDDPVGVGTVTGTVGALAATGVAGVVLEPLDTAAVFR